MWNFVRNVSESGSSMYLLSDDVTKYRCRSSSAIIQQRILAAKRRLEKAKNFLYGICAHYPDVYQKLNSEAALLKGEIITDDNWHLNNTYFGLQWTIGHVYQGYDLSSASEPQKIIPNLISNLTLIRAPASFLICRIFPSFLFSILGRCLYQILIFSLLLTHWAQTSFFVKIPSLMWHQFNILILFTPDNYNILPLRDYFVKIYLHQFTPNYHDILCRRLWKYFFKCIINGWKGGSAWEREALFCCSYLICCSCGGVERSGLSVVGLIPSRYNPPTPPLLRL